MLQLIPGLQPKKSRTPGFQGRKIGALCQSTDDITLGLHLARISIFVRPRQGKKKPLALGSTVKIGGGGAYQRSRNPFETLSIVFRKVIPLF